MDMMKITKTNRGFTLIEVMIAIFLFGIGFLAASSMLLNSSRTSTVMKYSTLALWRVSDKIESFKSLSFTPGAAATLPPQLTPDGFRSDSAGGAEGDMYDLWRSDPRGNSAAGRTATLSDIPQGQLNWFVEDDINSPNATEKRIGICVSWIPPGGQTVYGVQNVKTMFGTLVKTPGM